MTLDLNTVTFMTAVVGVVAGAVFIAETLLRRDQSAGRVWAISYLCGIATTIAYGLWAAGVAAVVAVSVGNALFAMTVGFLWLGCRGFNERPLLIPTIVTLAIGVLITVDSILESDIAGDWAGWPLMSTAIIVFCVAGAVECFRRPMGRSRTAWTLGVVMAVIALYYAIRLTAYLVMGADSALFLAFFGTAAASIATISLTIVAVVVTSVLRAGKASLRGYAWLSDQGVAADGILLPEAYRLSLVHSLERAQWRGEDVGVVTVRLEDLAQITTAFGSDASSDLIAAWRRGIRRFAPSDALVGESEDDAVLCATIFPETAAEARRVAAAIYRGVLDTLGDAGTGVIPVVGVGVTLTQTVGYDAARIISSSSDAARAASTSVEASVLFGGTAEVLADLT